MTCLIVFQCSTDPFSLACPFPITLKSFFYIGADPKSTTQGPVFCGKWLPLRGFQPAEKQFLGKYCSRHETVQPSLCPVSYKKNITNYSFKLNWIQIPCSLLKPVQGCILAFNKPCSTHIMSKVPTLHPLCSHFVPHWLLRHTQLLLPVSPGGGESSCQLVPTVNYYIWDCGAWRQPAACGVGWREPVQPWQLSKVIQTDKHSLFLCMIHYLFCGSCLVRLEVSNPFHKYILSNTYFWKYISLLFTSF